MLMETLEREVEALNAEVTRLRLMVYYLKDATYASAPPSAAPARSASGHCSACGGALVPREPAARPAANSGAPAPADRVSKQVLEAVAQLLAASKDVGAALPALCEGCKGKRSERLRRSGRSLKEKGTTRHRSHRRPSSSYSSASSSVAAASSSSSSKSSHTESRGRGRFHRHAVKKKGRNSRRRSASVEEKQNASSTLAPQEGSSQEKKRDAPRVAAQCQWPQTQAEEEADYGSGECNAARSSLRSCQEADACSTANDPLAASDAADRSILPSLGASYGMLASILGSSASGWDQRNLVSKEEQSSSAVAASTPPLQLDKKEEEGRETPLSTDENGYPIVAYSSFSISSFSPAKAVKVASTTPEMKKVGMSGTKGSGGAQMQFTPLSVARTELAPRRSLLARIHEASVDSTASEESPSAPAAPQGTGAAATSPPLSPGGAPNTLHGALSGENVSRKSFANAATVPSSLGSFGGCGVEMIEEYGFALNDSFSASASGGNLDTRKNTPSFATLPRTHAMYHLRNENEND
ncbi:uncharacterized protein Tco025E_03585 [Trypanosoma conorhini]|uniref:Uncharacterized protein n=1 Tax=Trypanosoma conorhini TaxID=83891 RepID=A0A422PSW9_9TRYP|nr:uncharacterized protein Tco025E_03585 [Trypanosoma conorhini]RNF20855.1 hypothetical protein Tco025E_03585 [Trypanosoma conorhini]